MKNKLFVAKVVFSLMVFSPLALIPSMGRSALLSSRSSGLGGHPAAAGRLTEAGIDFKSSSRLLEGLTPLERQWLAEGKIPVARGGEAKSNINQSLSTNHAVAIILTLIMLGCVFAFVEQSRD